MAIYKNSEWVVDSYGIEGIGSEKGYWIDMDLVATTTERGGIEYYDWPVHIAEKECVPIQPFIDAFGHALRYCANRNGFRVDEAMLIRTIFRAVSYYRTYSKVTSPIMSVSVI